MSDLEVIIWKDELSDSYCIKLRKKENGIKRGLLLKVTEEWLEKHLKEVPEGTEYYVARRLSNGE